MEILSDSIRSSAVKLLKSQIINYNGETEVYPSINSIRRAELSKNIKYISIELNELSIVEHLAGLHIV